MQNKITATINGSWNEQPKKKVKKKKWNEMQRHSTNTHNKHTQNTVTHTIHFTTHTAHLNVNQ